MKMMFLLVWLPLFSYCGALPPMAAEAVHADTETTTNVILSIDLSRFNQMRFVVEMDASPSNSLQIAIGMDADDDGMLSLEEEALAFGYDCGEWTEHDAVRDLITTESTVTSGRVRREFTLKQRSVNPDWNLLRVVRCGIGELNELVECHEDVVQFIFMVQ